MTMTKLLMNNCQGDDRQVCPITEAFTEEEQGRRHAQQRIPQVGIVEA